MHIAPAMQTARLGESRKLARELEGKFARELFRQVHSISSTEIRSKPISPALHSASRSAAVNLLNWNRWQAFTSSTSVAARLAPMARPSAAVCAHSPSSEPFASDVVVVNTCSVTAEADRAARAFIRRAHRRNPAAKIVVTGCYAQRAPQELARMAGVAAVVGNSHKALAPEIVFDLANGLANSAAADASALNRARRIRSFTRAPRTLRPSGPTIDSRTPSSKMRISRRERRRGPTSRFRRDAGIAALSA